MNFIMMQKGLIVQADAGRDSGKYFVVTDFGGGYCMIADGKSRKLSSPKRKNVKHIRATNSKIELNGITDKKLRTLLKEFGCTE